MTCFRADKLGCVVSSKSSGTGYVTVINKNKKSRTQNQLFATSKKTKKKLKFVHVQEKIGYIS